MTQNICWGRQRIMNDDDMTWDHEEVRTFAYLHSAADWAVEQAESTQDRQMFPSMHAILTSVHCIEAFTNHLGPRVFADRWDTKEANLATPRDKLRALLSLWGGTCPGSEGVRLLYARFEHSQGTHAWTHARNQRRQTVPVCRGKQSLRIGAWMAEALQPGNRPTDLRGSDATGRKAGRSERRRQTVLGNSRARERLAESGMRGPSVGVVRTSLRAA